MSLRITTPNTCLTSLLSVPSRFYPIDIKLGGIIAFYPILSTRSRPINGFTEMLTGRGQLRQFSDSNEHVRHSHRSCTPVFQSQQIETRTYFEPEANR
jgi:hypothetical protein